VSDPAHPALLGQPLEGHDNVVNAVAFSPRGHLLASGSSDDSASLWNVAKPAQPKLLSQGQQAVTATGAVWTVAFSPDASTLAMGTDTGYPQNSTEDYLYLWNVIDPARPVYLSEPTGHGGPVYAVAFSPKGSILASGSADQTICL